MISHPSLIIQIYVLICSVFLGRVFPEVFGFVEDKNRKERHQLIIKFHVVGWVCKAHRVKRCLKTVCQTDWPVVILHQKSTFACFTKHAKCMTLSILETSLPRQRSHDTLASGISAKNWCLASFITMSGLWLSGYKFSASSS